MYESEYTPEEWKMIGEELDLELDEEVKRWADNQVHEGLFSINPRLLQIKVNVLIAVLRKFGVSEEELDAIFKQEALEQMKQDYNMFMEQKHKVDIAVAQTHLLRPNGTPFQ